MIRLKMARFREDQQGFTLPELMTTIAILGILIAIGVIIFLALLERWRVNAAVNQLASDLRTVHQRATNQLTDWRVIIVPEKGAEEEGPDYYLVKLNGVYESGYSTPTAERVVPRTLPANVRVMNQTDVNNSLIQDDKADAYYVSPDSNISGPTRTLEFNTDGAMTGYGSPSGTMRVTIDGDPKRSVRYLSATSRIKVLP